MMRDVKMAERGTRQILCHLEGCGIEDKLCDMMLLSFHGCVRP